MSSNSEITPPTDSVEQNPEVTAALAADARDNECLRLLMAFALSADSNCIDIGAQYGSVLSQMVNCAPQGHHIAYEPLPEIYAQLQTRFPGFDVRCAALSNKSGERTFTHVVTDPGYSGFRQRTYPGPEELRIIQVPVVTLDSSLPEGYIPALIKIDVEGAEREVIEGAIETICKHRPIVVFEHGRGAAEHYETSPEDIYELLSTRAGLRIYTIHGDGPLTLATFRDTFDRGSCWNFVAHR